MFETVAWKGDWVELLDQRLLPGKEDYLRLRTPEDVAEAIRSMAVRGAPAIGVTAAMGLALGARQASGLPPDGFRRRFEDLCRLFSAARPTAVNLFWAVERMRGRLERALASSGDPDAGGPSTVPHAAEGLVEEAIRIKEEDIEACRRIGRHGAALVPESATILTHCNAGGLATAGYGTALGVVRAAVEAGKTVRVLADETRPFLQGARLTAWELMKDGIPTTLITDSMAGSMMRSGAVTLVIVGADRIAANGDVANKVGTYPLSVLARENRIPFYVAAPVSTLDLSTPDGDHIPIEQRDPSEVTHVAGVPVAPEGVSVRNPAFDVTPHRYITAIITDRGVARPPYAESLRNLASA
jgi:methylthioribose-1-phosphate isomerase